MGTVRRSNLANQGRGGGQSDLHGLTRRANQTGDPRPGRPVRASLVFRGTQSISAGGDGMRDPGRDYPTLRPARGRLGRRRRGGGTESGRPGKRHAADPCRCIATDSHEPRRWPDSTAHSPFRSGVAAGRMSAHGHAVVSLRAPVLGSPEETLASATMLWRPA